MECDTKEQQRKAKIKRLENEIEYLQQKIFFSKKRGCYVLFLIFGLMGSLSYFLYNLFTYKSGNDTITAFFISCILGALVYREGKDEKLALKRYEEARNELYDLKHFS